MRLDPALEQMLDHACAEVALVRTEGARLESKPPTRAIQQTLAPLRLRRGRSEDLDADARQNPVSVLHQRVHRVARDRRRFPSFPSRRSDSRDPSRSMRRVARFSPRKSTARLPDPAAPPGPLDPAPADASCIRRDPSPPRSARSSCSSRSLAPASRPRSRDDSPNPRPSPASPSHRTASRDARRVEAPPPVLAERRCVPCVLIEVSSEMRSSRPYI